MCKKLLTALFCGVLGLSFLIFNIFSRQLSGDNHENRLLTGLPQVLQSPLSQLPENLNNFIADNSPFRYQLVELNANVNYLLFGQVNNDQVLAGKDGWLFYKDGPDAARPVANYQGLPDTFYSEAELAAAAASLDRLSAALAQHGCTLVLDLTPSKDRVYQEYMPDGYPIVRTENRTDRLAAYLQQHTSARVSWQYPALRARALADPDQPLYFRTDTHWNSAGALIGLDGRPDGGRSAMSRLFRLLHCPERHPDRGPGQCGGAVHDSARRPGVHRRQLCRALSAQDARTVGVLGDSFSEYYMAYLSRAVCRLLAGGRREPALTPALVAGPGL